MTNAGALDVSYRPTPRIWLRLVGTAWNVGLALLCCWIGVWAVSRDGRGLVDLVLGPVLAVVGVVFVVVSLRHLIRGVRWARRHHRILAMDAREIRIIAASSTLRWDDCAAVVVSRGPWPRAARRGICVVQFVAASPDVVVGSPDTRHAGGLAAILGISAADARTTCVMTKAMTHSVGDVVAFARAANPGLQIVSAADIGLDLKGT
ncbi:hypothetical protein [Nocardioides speluncae]|uniref:hypothetical protein n=1 Tax=Nocardioides speluncae TaxID=2670337 RepID=UPI000D686A7D|nr:hypothetical protein [Nocardioides speluncae]